MIDEVEGSIVATCGGSELAREASVAREGAQNTPAVWALVKLTPRLAKRSMIRGDGGGCCVVAPDPVVHVIDRKEQDIGSLGQLQRGIPPEAQRAKSTAAIVVSRRCFIWLLSGGVCLIK